jgi:hypothetical protein
MCRADGTMVLCPCPRTRGKPLHTANGYARPGGLNMLPATSIHGKGSQGNGTPPKRSNACVLHSGLLGMTRRSDSGVPIGQRLPAMANGWLGDLPRKVSALLREPVEAGPTRSYTAIRLRQSGRSAGMATVQPTWAALPPSSPNSERASGAGKPMRKSMGAALTLSGSDGETLSEYVLRPVHPNRSGPSTTVTGGTGNGARPCSSVTITPAGFARSVAASSMPTTSRAGRPTRSIATTWATVSRCALTCATVRSTRERHCRTMGMAGADSAASGAGVTGKRAKGRTHGM